MFRGKTPPPLRSSFSWTFAGNAVYGAGQWAILSLIARLGSADMLGEYALALAVTTPVVMLSHLNLRTVLATDMARRHPLGDYLAVRLATSALALACIAGVAAGSAYLRPLAAIILLTGLAQSIENVSDVYYGALQRRDRMEQVGRSMIARGIVSAAGLGFALWVTGNLIWAVCALALARLAVLLAYDFPRGSAGESLSRSGPRSRWIVLRTALPLGVVLMLVSLNTNMPRYAIEHHLGTVDLGSFAAVASFLAIGATLINALGQAATPRLALYFSDGDFPRFLRFTLRLAGLALALGVAGVLASALLGKFVLRLIYGASYAAYSELLVAVMGAAAIAYVANILGYVSSSARQFAAQMPLAVAATAACGIASWILVPRLGLYGAAVALAIAACLQVGGQTFIILRRARLEN